MFADLAREAKVKELSAWQNFWVFEPYQARGVSTKVVQTRWALTCKATGYQGPDLREGIVDASGRVSLPSCHLQGVSLCAINKGKIWGLYFKNAFSQADGFIRDVFLRAPMEWDPPRYTVRMTRQWNLAGL